MFYTQTACISNIQIHISCLLRTLFAMHTQLIYVPQHISLTISKLILYRFLNQSHYFSLCTVDSPYLLFRNTLIYSVPLPNIFCKPIHTSYLFSIQTSLFLPVETHFTNTIYSSVLWINTIRLLLSFLFHGHTRLSCCMQCLCTSA